MTISDMRDIYECQTETLLSNGLTKTRINGTKYYANQVEDVLETFEDDAVIYEKPVECSMCRKETEPPIFEKAFKIVDEKATMVLLPSRAVKVFEWDTGLTQAEEEREC